MKNNENSMKLMKLKTMNKNQWKSLKINKLRASVSLSAHAQRGRQGPPRAVLMPKRRQVKLEPGTDDLGTADYLSTLV